MPQPTTTPDPPFTTTAAVASDDTGWLLSGREGTEITLAPGPVFMLSGSGDGPRHLLPSDADHGDLVGDGSCWALPEDTTSGALLIEAAGRITATRTDQGWTLRTQDPAVRITAHRSLPWADVDGAPFALDIVQGDLLSRAWAGFQWRTMLPCVVERTRAKDHPDAEGYVVSTLASTYLGTYPDVDHEFQIKGRVAAGSRLDLDVARRMIELQCRLAVEDPTGLHRVPCSVQPDGTREYHVRRSSMDGSSNAEMFLVTGNIELIEEAWLLVAATGDTDWLAGVVGVLERAAEQFLELVDGSGRLWGDVFYEDQVIKDGRETMAQALAVRSLELLAELDDLLGRADPATRYRQFAGRLRNSLSEPLPHGWWDGERERFVDWVDRDGRVHDHQHLLANVLPVLVGAASPDQERGVLDLVEREIDEFQRFPTFLAARIADYSLDEIGDGGPYDLCAAGRYWCWDAAWWRHRGDGERLLAQLVQVATEAEGSGWLMGERYDLDHVFYVDGESWHGAAHYYEYPCVFVRVLVHEYLGLQPAIGADLRVAPLLVGDGAVTLGQWAHQVSYRVEGSTFTLTNLADKERRFALDLSWRAGEVGTCTLRAHETREFTLRA